MSSLEKLFRIVDIGPNAENKEEVFEFEKLCMFIFFNILFFLEFKYFSYLTFAPGSQVPKVLGGEGRASQI